MGILAGIAGSAVVAVFAAQISSAFEGRGQELFTAGVLMLAVVMLAWHVVWMAEHAREMTARLRQLGARTWRWDRARWRCSASVVGLAVMREGSEVVLFLTGILMQGTDGLVPLVLGSAGGLALGAAVSAVVYLGLAAVPLSRVFAVTGVLVTLLAAGLAAQAVHQLSNAGLLNVLDGTLWDTTWLLSEDSWPGRVLHVLIGYMDRPTLMQAIAYVATVVAILGLSTTRRAPERAPIARATIALCRGFRHRRRRGGAVRRRWLRRRGRRTPAPAPTA